MPWLKGWGFPAEAPLELSLPALTPPSQPAKPNHCPSHPQSFLLSLQCPQHPDGITVTELQMPLNYRLSGKQFLRESPK